jgi:hypothetical protein
MSKKQQKVTEAWRAAGKSAGELEVARLRVHDLEQQLAAVKMQIEQQRADPSQTTPPAPPQPVISQPSTDAHHSQTQARSPDGSFSSAPTTPAEPPNPVRVEYDRLRDLEHTSENPFRARLARRAFLLGRSAAGSNWREIDRTTKIPERDERGLRVFRGMQDAERARAAKEQGK